MGCSRALKKQGYKWNRKTKTCVKKAVGASTTIDKNKETRRLKIRM